MNSYEEVCLILENDAGFYKGFLTKCKEIPEELTRDPAR